MSYLDICADKIKLKLTNMQLAEKHECARTRIDTALRYGTSCGFFTFELGEKLQHSIADLRDDTTRLERDLKRQRRRPRGLTDEERACWRPNHQAVAALARIILDYKTRLMELEGIYKQVLSIDVRAKVDKTITIRRIPAGGGTAGPN